jgi:hypothetical protein
MNRSAVPEETVVNMSRMGPYKRSSGNRVRTAQERDPTAYSLHKRGIEGARIQCDCGAFLINNKRARHYHQHHHKDHLSWLANGALARTPDEAVRFSFLFQLISFEYTHKCNTADNFQ